MNREDIISMAHKSHLDVYGLGTDYAKFADALERFAALVRANEREACAKVCEDIYNDPKGNNGDDYYYTRPYLECADAIRAREEA